MKKLFAILFLTVTLLAAPVNFILQGSTLKQTLSELTNPKSPANIRVTADTVEFVLSRNIFEKMRFVEAYSFLQTLMGKEEVGNFAMARARNGMLNPGSLLPPNMTRLREYAARVYWMKRIVEDTNGRFLFVSPPARTIKGTAGYPVGMPVQDLTPVQNSFLNYLREYGVTYLDTRVSLREDGLPDEETMYKTDPSWTTRAAFESFREVVTELEQVFEARLDPDGTHRNRDNYTFRPLPSPFLGTFGRYTGKAFGGLDKFTAIWPKSADNQQYSVEMVDPVQGFSERKGVPESSLYDPAALTFHGDLYTYNPENFYLSGIKSWARIRNMQNLSGPRLLLIHDTCGTPLATFMAPLFGEVHTIWAHSNVFSVNIDQYLVDNHFDFVILVLSPSSYNDDSMNFFAGPKTQ